jgi:hypothetical protein
MPRSGGLTLELKGKTTPERLIAEIRRVDPKTVTRWAKAGRIES